MKISYLAFAILGALALSACHGNTQVPPASPGYNVVLTASLPAAPNSCTTTPASPCTFAFYAETIAAGASCDPTTSANYKEITNPASRPTTLTFTDANTTGLTRCYNAETVQAGANSAPSNTAQVVSPGVPSQLTLAPNAVVAALEKPLSAPEPQQATMASNVVPIILSATVESRRR